jgi:hypothetical protein
MGLVTGLALGASALGGALSASSANKNAKRAAQTSANANTQNIAFATQGRDMAYQRLDPYNNRGNTAGIAINDLLGIGGGSQVQGGPQSVGTNALMQYGGNAGAPYGLGDTPGYSYGGFGGGVLNSALATYQGQQGLPAGTGGTTPQAAPQSAAAAQTGAFDRFRDSTGYQFRLGEGLDAVNSAYAGIGGFQSGAALRGINEYGQNFASNEFGNYLNALSNQQAVGASAASSAAGVSQNFASQAINSNSNNAQNQMYAQLSRQNPFANVLGTLGGFGVSGGFGGG